MLIIMGFYHRRPDLTWEQFSDHWKNVHGPLLRNSPQTKKYIRRYVQHHIRPNTAWDGVAPLDYDGFSEVWYDSIEARKEMQADPFWQETMVADEALFLDMSKTRISMFDNPVIQVGHPVQL